MMQRTPFIHSSRNDAQRVRFNDSFIWIDLADGRVIGLPFIWFPWLQNATDAQRQTYELLGDSIYWEELDEGIDLVAMLTALYINDLPHPKGAMEPAKAATT